MYDWILSNKRKGVSVCTAWACWPESGEGGGSMCASLATTTQIADCARDGRCAHGDTPEYHVQGGSGGDKVEISNRSIGTCVLKSFAAKSSNFDARPHQSPSLALLLPPPKGQ